MADESNKLSGFLAEIATAPEFPALSRSIEQVMVKVEEDSSIQHITNIILKDYSLTLRILRTANSALYNRSGTQIRSVSQAIMMLGVESVREMVAGVVLLEHFRKRSPGLKELILLSLLTANHARDIAARMGYPKLEEAYLCGMFRNLGEVLVACYQSRGYAAILLRVQQDRIPVQQACQEALGFDYDQAGKAVAQLWKIPENIRECMGDQAARLRRAPFTELERLAALANFAHKLTSAVYRREPGEARASVNLLLNSQGPMLSLSHADAKAIVDRALEETNEIFQAMSVPLDHLRLKRQTEAALHTVEQDPPAESEAGQEAEAPETLASLLRDVTAQVTRNPGDLRSITLMVMEAIYRGGPFDHVLFALLDESGHRLVGKLGFGESIDRIVRTFSFPVSAASGPLALVMLKGLDIFVSGPRDRRFDGTRFVQVMAAPIFGMLPVFAGGSVLGCLYFDRQEPKHFDASALATIGALRDQLSRSLAHSRTGNLLAVTELGR